MQQDANTFDILSFMHKNCASTMQWQHEKLMHNWKKIK